MPENNIEKFDVAYITTGYPYREDSARGIFVFRLLKYLVKKSKGFKAEVLVPGPSNHPSPPLPNQSFDESIRLNWFRYMVPQSLQVFTDGTFIDCLRKRPWTRLILPLFLLQFALDSLAVCLRKKLIHCYWSVSALFPVAFKFIHNKPIVLTVLGSDMAVLDKGLMKKVNTFVLRHVDCCIVLGEEQKKLVQDRTRRVEIVPLGVDNDLYYPRTNEQKNVLRERLGISLDKVIVSWVGMFIPVKGIELLIPVCHELRKRGIDNLQFLLIGSGIDKDVFLEQIKQENLDDYFYYAGNTPCHETPLWVSASDISISCSHSEGLCTALCEAAVCGLPIVATRAGEIETIVEHSRNGYIIEERDVMQFSDALAGLVENEDLRKQMGQAGAERLAYLTCERSAERLMQLYRELI